MIYGLYLSATGVLANSYRQDVIANNLANAETVGFKRDLALFHERLTASQEERHLGQWSDPRLENLGGGLLASPTTVDITQGELEPTGNNLDVAIEGPGFFTIDDHGEKKLTRDGRFIIDRAGQLVLSNGMDHRVLGTDGRPIALVPGIPAQIGKDGVITQGGRAVNRIGVFDVPNPAELRKQGDLLITYPDMKQIRPAPALLRSQFVERANIDPANELATLMDVQRQLEANANMIRYQDQTLSKLVNEVGKIS